MKYITLLGSTGSVGNSTLDVISRHPDRFSIYALAAQKNWRQLAIQCERFHPKVAVLASPEAAQLLSIYLRDSNIRNIEVMYGIRSLREISMTDSCDTVVSAIVGAAGLDSTFAAAKAGKRILLANKEVLVIAGKLFTTTVQYNNAKLFPLDSEHNAIFQCLPNGIININTIEKLILTASGGPFKNYAFEALVNVTPAEACNHPNWSMGRKISVDSATMMNKGLEIIEAHWLFGLPKKQIEVLIHPQSIVHSMISYLDGSVITQLSNPDMRIPIAHALAYPDRIATGVPQLDLAAIAQLNFENVNLKRFPCLQLAFEALSNGGSASTVLSAANEIAVQAFLDGRLCFTSIPKIIELTLTRASLKPLNNLDDIIDADLQARIIANDTLNNLSIC